MEINTLFEQEEPALELVIHKESMRDFMYGIKSVGREVSEQLINDENLHAFSIVLLTSLTLIF